MSRSILFVSSSILFAACSSSWAQTAQLTGTVTAGPKADPIREAVATIRATDGGEQLAVTTVDGIYRFERLQDNKTYRLIIEASGFQIFEQSGILLAAGQISRIDVTLALASKTEIVNVTDYVGDGDGVSAEVIQLIDSNQLHDLPNLNRSVSKFALLDSQVRPAIGLGGRLPGRQQTFH